MSVTPAVPSQWVSVDCRDGELTLALAPDASFCLALALWDERNQICAARKVMNGQWRLVNDQLVLDGTSAEIVYERGYATLKLGVAETQVDAWRWMKSSGESFADQYTLLERTTVDRLVVSAGPQAPG